MAPARRKLEIFAVPGIGEVGVGDDVAALIGEALDAAGMALHDGDVVVVASKVVSKAAGRTVALHPGETAEEGRRRLALHEEVLVDTPHVVVVRTAAGLVCANAGIDASNVPGGRLLLLPQDPDAAAEALRSALRRRAGCEVGVVIADTFGRAWREGQTDIALGVAGLPALRDERGAPDRQGQPLKVTLVALADQVAGAADLLRDKAAGLPVVVVRGLPAMGGQVHGGGASLIRRPEDDLFPHGRGWLARRLATGLGAAVRSATPTEEEWQMVLAAAPGAIRTGAQLQVADGRSAGRAEAALLDLGYEVTVAGDGPWVITAGSGATG